MPTRPYPIEELAEVIGFHKTRVPLVCLVGGILGGLSGYLLQYWINTISYPLNIGGRPLHSWPAFIIVTFEMTILFGGLAAAIGMLGLNGLPAPYHPVFNNPRFSSVTRDRFFLCIEAADPQVRSRRSAAIALGLQHRRRHGGPGVGMKSIPRSPAKLLLAGSSLLDGVVLLAGCGLRLDMQDQPKFKPLRENDFYSDKRSSRALIGGTVARGQLDADAYLNTGMMNGKEGDVMPFPVTPAVLDRGRERFNIYCSPCHSQLGDGNGMVVQRGFKHPPSYHIDRLRKAPIGHFFNVMTKGYGAMADYSAQVPVNDRWAIAAYIRVAATQPGRPAQRRSGGSGDRLASASGQCQLAAAADQSDGHARRGRRRHPARREERMTADVSTRDFAPPAAPLARWRKRALMIGVAAGILSIIGVFVSPDEFLRGYLMGFMVCLGLTLGSVAWLMTGHLTGGNWWMISRRLFEAAAKTLPLVTVMFLPIAFGMHRLYLWTHTDVVAADKVLQAKQFYLNTPTWILRAVIYFVLWNLIVYLLARWSARQDADDSPSVWRFMKVVSGAGAGALRLQRQLRRYRLGNVAGPALVLDHVRAASSSPSTDSRPWH